MLSIICWKWNNGSHPRKGIIYGPEHVNILYAMFKRHLHIPFEMVCITDDPRGINKDIRIIKLWDDYQELGGCYRRLKIFSSEAEKILDVKRFVSIDLDTVIVRDITPIFDRDDDFIIWGEEWRKWVYCASLMMMDSGTRPQVWAQFNPKNYHVKNDAGIYRGGTDQKHINNVLYPHEKTWSTKDGIYSFATDIMIYKERMVSRYGIPKLLGGTGKLPGNAKIIFFNGKYDPSQKKLWEQYHWIKEHWHE